MSKKILIISTVMLMMENWKKSNIEFDNNKLIIKFEEPFVPRRGRVNCSLNENGK